MRAKPRPVTFKRGVDTGEPGARNKACLEFATDAIDGADLLDVGCWAGAFASMALDKARTVTAVDIEPQALEVARVHAPLAGFIEASVLSLPFAVRSFDTVTLWDVLEHLPVGCESAAFDEIARVLRPGGYLALSVPCDNLLAKALDPMYFPKKHRHYSSDSLQCQLETSGFTVERKTTLGGLITASDFLVFCAWKYVLGKPGPSLASYRRICERDANREGFIELFMLAQLSSNQATCSRPSHPVE